MKQLSLRNKARRQELTKLRYFRRCKILGLDPKKHYAFKHQGKPCSCWMCSPYKYSRKTKHRDYASEYSQHDVG